VRAAEKIFADKGFRAMTLRDVTRQAKVNLAAVNYHFGSKTDLMRAVLREHFEPINRLRFARLDALVARHAPAPIPVIDIMDALVRPLFEGVNPNGARNPGLIRVIGRAISEPADFIQPFHTEFFGELTRRFLTELHRSCPQMSEEQLQFRLYLAVSTMIGSIVDQARLENMSGGKLDQGDVDRIVHEMVCFVDAGFRAP